VREIVLAMWQAVADRNWPSVRSYFARDCVFIDVPVGRTIAVHGPDDIVEKLQISLDPLVEYTNHAGLLLTDGADAIFEHSETWTTEPGRSAVMRFVSVHKVHDGKITYWKDYWDMGG